jgi:hypothetical protein
MAAGGLLISSPILIHLINRMRFKRIRWAAMEFLLKSQKRNRRKLIIEQLLLLLLRIFLVLLAGFLLARFIGFTFGKDAPQNTRNIVLLDDSLSMNDRTVDKGETKTALSEARRSVVEDVAKNAVKTGTNQFLKVLRITKPTEEIFSDKLTEQTIHDLQDRALPKVTGTTLHAELAPAIARAKELFDEAPQDKRVLYIVSDFRQPDWAGASNKANLKLIQDLLKQKVEVKCIDVAHPLRQEKEVRHHENIAITQFRPSSRLVAKNIQVDFSGYIANYGKSDRRNVQVRVRVDGKEDFLRSVVIPLLPAGGVEQPFTLGQPLSFEKADTPHAVAAYVDFGGEEEGLSEDNTRYAVIEVRERVPILAVDGDLPKSRQENGDAFFMRTIFESRPGSSALIPGYELQIVPPSELENLNLQKYASIYFLNVKAEGMKEKTLANLDRYVREGGSVAFFMGEHVDSKFYNELLYKDGKGIFPVPLEAAPSKELTDAERKERDEQARNDPQMQMFLRNEDHPMLRHLAGMQFWLRFLDINRYYPVPRAKWRAHPPESDELLTLPNRKTMDDYKEGLQKLLESLPLDDKDYGERLTFYRNQLRATIGKNDPLHRLASQLEDLLKDKGDPRVQDKPDLTVFWAQPERAALRGEVERWLDTVRFGDPLVVTAKVGQGRSVVCLTTLGKRGGWNNWAGGADGSDTFPGFIDDLQRFLISVPQGNDLHVGDQLKITIDPTVYQDKVVVSMRNDKGPELSPIGDKLPATAREAGRADYVFDQADAPGVYVVELTAQNTGEKQQKAYAFNVDTSAESDLRRTSLDDLTLAVNNPLFIWRSAGSSEFAPPAPPTDSSETPWLYLLFLLVLVAEQAMAVHLSFHAHAHGAPGTPAPRPAVA